MASVLRRSIQSGASAGVIGRRRWWVDGAVAGGLAGRRRWRADDGRRWRIDDDAVAGGSTMAVAGELTVAVATGSRSREKDRRSDLQFGGRQHDPQRLLRRDVVVQLVGVPGQQFDEDVPDVV